MNKLIQQDFYNSRTVHYLLDRICDGMRVAHVGPGHQAGTLCRNALIECPFCDRYKCVLDRVEMHCARKIGRKIHRGYIEKINMIIRSIPPNGVDYINVRDNNVKSGWFK